ATEPELNPVVGFLVFYSEMGDAKSGFPDPRLGRMYPMRESDVFFVGKAPLPEEVPVEGELTAAPTGHHLFPATSDYSHISRRHAVIRIGKDGTIRVTDLSTNGLYFVKTRRHSRRASGAPPEVHTFEGADSIVFGLDDNSFKDPNWKEKTDRFQVEIIPVPGEATR
ncbi:MAG: FHA domain-containing protein, partial [Candidatus Eisenbacteria bacterium]|nr:FHA domain-containing protein [Candidatus Eisenbacteria bacterium]